MNKYLPLLTVFLMLPGCLIGPDLNRVRGPAGDGYYYLSRSGDRIFKMKPPTGEWWISYPAILGGRVIKDEPIVFSENSKEAGSLPSVNVIADFAPTNEQAEFSRWSKFIWQRNLAAMREDGFAEVQSESTDGLALASLHLDGVHCARSERVLEKFGVFYRAVTCPGFSGDIFGIITIQVSVSLRDGEAAARDRMKMIEGNIQRSLSSLKFIKPFSQIAPAGFSIDAQLSD